MTSGKTSPAQRLGQHTTRRSGTDQSGLSEADRSARYAETITWNENMFAASVTSVIATSGHLEDWRLHLWRQHITVMNVFAKGKMFLPTIQAKIVTEHLDDVRVELQKSFAEHVKESFCGGFQLSALKEAIAQESSIARLCCRESLAINETIPNNHIQSLQPVEEIIRELYHTQRPMNILVENIELNYLAALQLSV